MVLDGCDYRIRRIARGEFGYDLRFALEPLTGRDLDIGPPTEKGGVVSTINGLTTPGLKNFMSQGTE